MRQKFRTNHSAEPEKQAYRQRHQTDTDRKHAMLDAPAHAPAIALGQVGHYWVVPLSDSSSKQHASQDGGDQYRKGQSSQKRESHSEGHGPEQPAFHPLQRKD